MIKKIFVLQRLGLISLLKLVCLKLYVGFPNAKFMELCFYSMGSISVEILN